MANEVVDVIMEATDTTGRKKKRQFACFDPAATDGEIYTFMTNMNNLTTRQYVKSTVVTHKPILQPHITPTDITCSFSNVSNNGFATFTINTVLQTLKTIYYKTNSMSDWSNSGSFIDNIKHAKDSSESYNCAIINTSAGFTATAPLTIKAAWDVDGEYYAGEQEFIYSGEPS